MGFLLAGVSVLFGLGQIAILIHIIMDRIRRRPGWPSVFLIFLGSYACLMALAQLQGSFEGCGSLILFSFIALSIGGGIMAFSYCLPCVLVLTSKVKHVDCRAGDALPATGHVILKGVCRSEGKYIFAPKVTRSVKKREPVYEPIVKVSTTTEKVPSWQLLDKGGFPTHRAEELEKKGKITRRGSGWVEYEYVDSKETVGSRLVGYEERMTTETTQKEFTAKHLVIQCDNSEVRTKYPPLLLNKGEPIRSGVTMHKGDPIFSGTELYIAGKLRVRGDSYVLGPSLLSDLVLSKDPIKPADMRPEFRRSLFSIILMALFFACSSVASSMVGS